MELRVDLLISAAIYECKKMPLIVDVKINEKETLTPKNSFPLTIYFASAGESIWDIARRYFADVDELCTLNGISGSKLEADTAILVPIK